MHIVSFILDNFSISYVHIKPGMYPARGERPEYQDGVTNRKLFPVTS